MYFDDDDPLDGQPIIFLYSVYSIGIPMHNLIYVKCFNDIE